MNYFGLPINFEDTYAYTRQEALRKFETGSQGEMIDTIIRKVKKLEETYDITVIEGSDFIGESTTFEFEANVSIARNLRSPMIAVISGENKTTANIVNAVLTVLRNFVSREVHVLALVANKVKPTRVYDIYELLSSQIPKGIIVSVIPENKNLLSPSFQEICEHLGGKLIAGKEYLSNQVDHFITGAMQVPNFLNHIKENVLIVTPGDRGDIMICALQANISANYPKVAGIILTGGFEPEAPVLRLIEGLQTVVPIISVKTGTFKTTTQIGSIKPGIKADNTKKIQLPLIFLRDM